jgi:tetratricopeptide (TPR) repeat protein
VNTDARPILEFSAPRFVNANTTAENLQALMAVRTSEENGSTQALVPAASGDNHRHKGEMFLVAEAFEQARKEFEQAILIDIDDSQAWKDLLDTDRGTDHAGLHKFVEDELMSHTTKTVRLAAAELFSRENDHGKAVALLDAVLKSEPDSVEVLERLAEELNGQDGPRLKEITERLLVLSPNDAIGLYHLATVLVNENRLDEAIQVARRSLEADPHSARIRNLLAIVYGQTFQLQLAEQEFQRALKEFPDDWISYNNYGLFLLERNRLDEARAQFAHAIRLNPDNVQGFVGIGETLRQAGNMRAAQIWYRKALRLEPHHPVARQYLE